MSDENQLYRFSQEVVMQDYANSGAFRDPRDAGRLHMFFSPRRVPLGLTDEQIRVCLAIAHLKEEKEEAERKLRLSQIPEELRWTNEDLYYEKLLRAHLEGGQHPRSLPCELFSPDYMDEESFKTGICKLLASL